MHGGREIFPAIYFHQQILNQFIRYVFQSSEIYHILSGSLTDLIFSNFNPTLIVRFLFFIDPSFKHFISLLTQQYNKVVYVCEEITKK